MPFKVTRIANRLQLAETWKSPEQKERVVSKWRDAGVNKPDMAYENRFCEYTDYIGVNEAHLMELVAKAIFQVVNDLEKDLVCGFVINRDNSLNFNISIRESDED